MLVRRCSLCNGYMCINILKTVIYLKVKGNYMFIAILNRRIRAL